jgi:mxaJ protein
MLGRRVRLTESVIVAVRQIRRPNPPRKLIDAVENGDIDIAISWGPFAGFFARQEKFPLVIVPVSPSAFLGVPFAYGISAAVRVGNQALKGGT